MKSFQSFRLDTANQCLWHDEDRVPIPPKAYDVLRYLVENPGRLVTQDELLEKLWPKIYVNPELVKNTFWKSGRLWVTGRTSRNLLKRYPSGDTGLLLPS
jgi:DNA-binding response OmpR family regulator